MDENIKLWGFVILVGSNLIAIVVMLTTMRNKLSYLSDLFSLAVADGKAQIIRQDAIHAQHFAHAANTGIHQESMSKDTLTLHFSSMESQIKTLGEQFAMHSRDDMEVMRALKEELGRIRERLPALGAVA